MAAQKTKGVTLTTERVGEVIRVSLPIKDILRFNEYLKGKKFSVIDKLLPVPDDKNGNTIFSVHVMGPFGDTRKYIEDFQ